MIVLKSVSKKYSKDIFSNINYKFTNKCIYSIFGKNGIGKTTLLNIISKNIIPECGTVEYSNNNEFEHMMFIDENPFHFEFITGREFLIETLKLKSIEFNDDQINVLAEEFKILNSLDYMISTYSSGMKYKLLLILIFIVKPKILILDEPLVEVDILTLEQISDIFKELKKNSLIIFSTHIPNIAFKISNKILYLTTNNLIEVENEFESSNEIEDYILKLMKNNI